jgi:hypothetical protein
MSTSVNELDKRVTALEQQLAQFRETKKRDSTAMTPAERGAALLRDSPRVHDELLRGWTRALQQMGISGTPVGAERLQQMIREAGVKSENCEFSRELIEMREE